MPVVIFSTLPCWLPRSAGVFDSCRDAPNQEWRAVHISVFAFSLHINHINRIFPRFLAGVARLYMSVKYAGCISN